MKGLLGRTRLALAAFGLIALSATTASADYICLYSYFPGTSSLGTKGYVYFSYYTGPNCTGSFVAAKFLCTDGASGNPNCVYSNAFVHNETSIVGIAEQIREAARVGQRVLVGTNTCVGGASGCAQYIYFYGN